ncbi:MAG: hypothetical protein HHJ11_09350 [Phycicoccus sp.]|nr:hypothetical protein [Phycicoccus sp.]NMM34036.1 hypothetical protein [Phycicoccus sp.]
MSRETASRDLSLNALAVLTGGLTAAALVGTGFVTGLASDYTAQKAQAKALANAAANAGANAAVAPAADAPAPVATPRPVRTVITTRYVQGKAQVARPQTVTRSSASVSTVHTYRQPAPAPRAPAPRAPAPRAPAPSAAS